MYACARNKEYVVFCCYFTTYMNNKNIVLMILILLFVEIKVNDFSYICNLKFLGN